MTDFLKELRLKGTSLIALFTTVVVALFFPQQIGVLLFKANVLACAAVAGYLLDRGLFPYARPNESNPESSWMIRRTALIVGVMLAASLAL